MSHGSCIVVPGIAKVNRYSGSLPVDQRFHAKPCLNSFVVRRTIASDPPQMPTATITYRANQDIKYRSRSG